jgi:hypothetical protein
MHEIETLHERLNLLLKRYGQLQQENSKLKKTVSEQLNTLDVLNKKMILLEENMLALQISKKGESPEDSVLLRKQIDNVIAEIDKILETLHD